MKKYVFVIAFTIFAVPLVAQHTSLLNTEWKGEFELPKKQTVKITFQKDTAIVYSETFAKEMGRLSFTQHNDTITVNKVSGASSCDPGIEGSYRIEWVDVEKKFLLHKIKDDCAERAASFTTSNPFQRILRR